MKRNNIIVSENFIYKCFFNLNFNSLYYTSEKYMLVIRMIILNPDKLNVITKALNNYHLKIHFTYKVQQIGTFPF